MQHIAIPWHLIATPDISGIDAEQIADEEMVKRYQCSGTREEQFLIHLHARSKNRALNNTACLEEWKMIGLFLPLERRCDMQHLCLCGIPVHHGVALANGMTKIQAHLYCAVNVGLLERDYAELLETLFCCDHPECCLVNSRSEVNTVATNVNCNVDGNDKNRAVSHPPRRRHKFANLLKS